MSTTTIAVESARLQAIAVTNGKVAADIVVRLLASTEPLHADTFNPISATAREAFIGHLHPDIQDEAGGLLVVLAEHVAATKAKTSPATGKKATRDDPIQATEPWDEPINGAVLLDDVVEIIKRYMVLPQEAVHAIALWVAHTYLADICDYTPYLLVSSPVRECGKSTLLDLLEHLVYRAQKSEGITAAALYRRIERTSPTMLIDELDTRLRGEGGESLRGVLNTGFHRGGKITVCSGDNHDDKDFRTYCPKILAGIGRAWDTVESRSAPIRIARASKEELSKLSKIRGDKISDICLPLRRKLTRWANDNREVLREADAVAPSELGARESDVWRPLFAIADAAGREWPNISRHSACKLHKVRGEETDHRLLLLQDLKVLFGDKPALSTEAILRALTDMDDRPWPEFYDKRPLTSRGLATLMGAFGIKSKNVRINGGPPVKGYERGPLIPEWERYLTVPLTPPELSATSATGLEVAPIDIQDQPEGAFVADVADSSGDKGQDVLKGFDDDMLAVLNGGRNVNG